MTASLSHLAATCSAFARSLYSYYVDNIPRPFSASFAITNACNLRCHYCNAPFLGPGGMSLEQVNLLFDRLYMLGVRRLGLFGGEPLLHPQCSEIARAARARHFYVSINSNLNLYQRMPQVFDFVDIVMTSLDGSAQTHRKARGQKSYDGLEEAIIDLLRRGKKVVAICVVSDVNLDQIEEALIAAERLGICVHFQPRSVDGQRARGQLDKNIDHKRRQSVWRQLLRWKKQGRAVASSELYLQHMIAWRDYTQTAYFDPRQRCAAGLGFLFVDPYGKAYPCGFIEGKVPPIDLLAENFTVPTFPALPCTTCAVGPYVEFNALFRAPVAGPIAAAKTYLLS